MFEIGVDAKTVKVCSLVEVVTPLEVVATPSEVLVPVEAVVTPVSPCAKVRGRAMARIAKILQETCMIVGSWVLLDL